MKPIDFRKDESIRFLIVLSLIVYNLKLVIVTTSTFFSPPTAPSIFIIPLLLTVGLVFGQLYMIATGNRLAWILSALQIPLIYFLSTGTFSWFSKYILQNLVSDRQFNAYIIFGFILITELLKTVWLYRKVK